MQPLSARLPSRCCTPPYSTTYLPTAKRWLNRGSPVWQGGGGGCKNTRQEPTSEKLNLQPPLQWYRTTTARGLEAPPAPAGVASSPRSLGESRHPAASDLAAYAGSSPQFAEGRRLGRKPQDGTWEPRWRCGLRGRSPPGTHGRPGKNPAAAAAEANRFRQRPSARGRRAGEGERRPAQAQTIAAPASGRPATSPHSRPNPSPGRPP